MPPSIRWFFRTPPRQFFSALLLLALFNCRCTPKQIALPFHPPNFDSARAFENLKTLCDFGPRNHGSEGKSRAEKWIQEKLKAAGAEVSLHQFNYTPAQTATAEHFTNIIGRVLPAAAKRVMIGTHYDTASWADHDPSRELRSTPIIGANDGASGVAVLLEMARIWKNDPPPVGVDLIFFDGEDFGHQGAEDDYLVGSKGWARDHPDYKPDWGIILDMIGDSSLEIMKERTSIEKAPQLIQRVWEAAERVHSTAFIDKKSGGVLDDQTAFLDRGVPVILLIDIDYPAYHTMQDLPDKCSPESLGQVGRAVMEAISTPY
jgi:hypothetical protein